MKLWHWVALGVGLLAIYWYNPLRRTAPQSFDANSYDRLPDGTIAPKLTLTRVLRLGGDTRYNSGLKL